MPERETRHAGAVLAGIVAVALALRLVDLGAKSYWVDEAYSLLFAQLDWSRFTQVVVYRELNQLPYYLLLREWIHLGTSEAVVRALSVVPAVATVPAIYALGAELFDRRTGLVAAALLSVNSWHLEYSQEARGYSLLILLVTLSLLLLVRAVRRPSALRWSAWALVSALAVYTHFYGALTLAAECVGLVFVPRRILPWRRALGAVAGVGLLLVPLVLFLSYEHVDSGYWIQPTSAGMVKYFVQSLFGAQDVPRVDALVMALTLAALITAAVRAWRSRASGESWPLALLATAAFLPIAAVLAISIVKPLFVPKYLIETLPPFVLLVAVGIMALRPRRVRVGALAVLLAALFVEAVAYYTRAPREDWRAAARYVLSQRQSRDAMLFFPTFVHIAFDLYRVAPAGDDAASEAMIARLASGPEPGALPYPRVWLVLSHERADPEHSIGDTVVARLSRQYREVRERSFTGIRVLLFDGPRVVPTNATG